MNKFKLRILTCALSLVMMFTVMPVRASINQLNEGVNEKIIDLSSIDLDVKGGELGIDFKYENNILTILTDKTLTISGTTKENRIVIQEGVNANIILNSVSIETDINQAYSPIVIEGYDRAADSTTAASITLAENSRNVLTSYGDDAALKVEDGSKLVIDGKGELTATSKGDGAGIGSSSGENSGYIEVKGGIITAISEGDGAGIGSGMGGSSDEIIITDAAIVTAVSNNRDMGAISKDNLSKPELGMSTNIIQIKSIAKINKNSTIEIRDKDGKSFEKPIKFKLPDIVTSETVKYESIAFSVPNADAEYTIYINDKESSVGIVNISQDKGIKNVDIFEPYITDENKVMAYTYVERYSPQGELKDRTLDVIGRFSNEWENTTMYNTGFTTCLKVNESESQIQAKSTSSGGYDVNGTNLNVAIDMSFANGGKKLVATYTVKNIGSESAIFSLASYEDIAIADDYYLHVTSLEGDTGVKLVSTTNENKNDAGENIQLNIFLKGIDNGITDVNGYWYGDWNDTTKYIFKDLENKKPLEDMRKGITWHWSNQTIEAGDTKTYSIKMGIGGPGSEIINLHDLEVSGIKDTITAKYEEGDKVEISAGTKEGYRFDKWTTSEGGKFADDNAEDTTFTMPANDVTITANWEPIYYNLQILGIIDPMNYKRTIDDRLEISAGTKEGYKFVNWTSDNGGVFSDETKAETTFKMPSNDVTITANWEKDSTDDSSGSEVIKKYNLSVSGTTNTIAAKYEKGDEVQISAGTKEGYKFVNWTSDNGGVFSDETKAETTFTMPANDVTITAKWEKDSTGNPSGSGSSSGGGGGSPSSSSTTEYQPNITPTSNGTVTLSTTKPSKGDKVTITPNPDEGYEISEIIVKDKDGNEIEVTKNTDGTYTFTQPSEAVTITQTFKKVEKLEEETKTQQGIKLDKTNHTPFMTGTSEGKFEPNRSISRAEVMVIFSRIMQDKMDDSKIYSSKFTDITGDEWYANAIGYMEQFGIISGYEDGSFRPNKAITRAEFAAIVARFETFVTTDSSKFADVKSDHWAAPYINSLVAQGFVNGYEDGTFRPDNNITRAEAAVIINRILGRRADKEFVEANMEEMKTFTDIDSSHWAYYEIIAATNTYE